MKNCNYCHTLQVLDGDVPVSGCNHYPPEVTGFYFMIIKKMFAPVYRDVGLKRWLFENGVLVFDKDIRKPFKWRADTHNEGDWVVPI